MRSMNKFVLLGNGSTSVGSKLDTELAFNLTVEINYKNVHLIKINDIRNTNQNEKTANQTKCATLAVSMC